jgi:DnaK suppressor protein
MNPCALNVNSRKATLLAKAEESRKMLRNARQDIWVETAPEAMDRALRATEREAAAEKVESSYRLLRQIEAALAREKRGRYGQCLKCAEEIEQKRLDALPWAMFCLDCQQAVDLLHQGAQARRNEIRRAA